MSEQRTRYCHKCVFNYSKPFEIRRKDPFWGNDRVYAYLIKWYRKIIPLTDYLWLFISPCRFLKSPVRSKFKYQLTIFGHHHSSPKRKITIRRRRYLSKRERIYREWDARSSENHTHIHKLIEIYALICG